MKKLNVLYIVIASLLFLYTLVRAYCVPPYFDELFSFFTYIQTGNFIPYAAHTNANNHVLNSFLSYLFTSAFGENFFFVRLASTLSIVIFMAYLWKLRQFIGSKYVSFILFIVLITSTYLTDFFILSRGYGISMAFLVAASFHLINYSHTGNRKEIYYTLFFSIVALWSNLSLVVPALVIWGMVFIVYLQNNKPATFKEPMLALYKPYTVFFIPLLLGILYSFKLKSSGSLYFGSDGGLIDAVFVKLSAEIAGSYFYGRIMLVLLTIIYTVSILLNIIGKQLKNANLLVQTLFWGTIVGYLLMHNILGVKYPQERAALQIYVLFIISLFFAIDNIRPNYLKYLFPLPTLMVTIQFIWLFNFTHIQHWKNQTVPYAFYQKIYGWQQQNNNIKPTIAGHGLLGKVLDYYDYKNGGLLNSTKDDTSPSKIADFIITNDWNSNIQNYDTLIYVKETSVCLLARKEPTAWEPFLNETAKDTVIQGNFYTMLEIPAKELVNQPVSVDVSFNIQSDNYPFLGFLVCSATTADNEKVAYTDVNLQTVKSDIRVRNTIHRRLFFEAIPANAEKLDIYLWVLKNKKGVTLSNVEIKLQKSV